MMYLILYDISSDKIREKVAKKLIAQGYERLQLSVFSGIRSPKHNKAFWAELQQLLQPEPAAKFYALKISENNFRQMLILGENELDFDYLTGSLESLFI